MRDDSMARYGLPKLARLAAFVHDVREAHECFPIGAPRLGELLPRSVESEKGEG